MWSPNASSLAARVFRLVRPLAWPPWPDPFDLIPWLLASDLRKQSYSIVNELWSNLAGPTFFTHGGFHILLDLKGGIGACFYKEQRQMTQKIINLYMHIHTFSFQQKINLPAAVMNRMGMYGVVSSTSFAIERESEQKWDAFTSLLPQKDKNWVDFKNKIRRDIWRQVR